MINHEKIREPIENILYSSGIPTEKSTDIAEAIIENLEQYNFEIIENKSKIKLEIRILKNFVDMMPKTYRKRNTNRTIVFDILTNKTKTMGSTSCHNKCLELGIDPDSYEI